MKKLILSVFSVASLAFVTNAVTYMRVKTDDGQIVRYDVSHVTEVDFEDDAYGVSVSGNIGGYAYVDLGLKSGHKWATCNIGADKYYEVGSHFAWGETAPEDTTLADCYSWGQYKWGDYYDLTKYVTMPSWGPVDNRTKLLPVDDAASQNCGEEWRMPTVEQQKELIDGCDWKFVENINNTGVSGMYGVSKCNQNTIFLPMTGYRWRKGLSVPACGWYWSSELNKADNGTAYLMKITSDGFTSMYQGRHDGMVVRPVLLNEDEIDKDTSDD